MVKMLSSFNAKNHAKMDDFTPIPAGLYKAQIIKSEMKETRDKEGHYLSLQFQVLDGENNKRIVFDRLNLHNKNPQTTEIAQKALATICEVCNVDELNDSEQLHNIPMNIKVVVKPQKAQYSEQNEIKGYTKIEGSSPIGMKTKTKDKSDSSESDSSESKSEPEKPTENEETGKKTPPWRK